MSKVKKKITSGMYDVIKSPVITEKSQFAAEHNKVVFLVCPRANKSSVKQAVEALFGVEVTKVNIVNRAGKVKRFKGQIGKQNARKHALVTIKEGQQIDLASTL